MMFFFTRGQKRNCPIFSNESLQLFFKISLTASSTDPFDMKGTEIQIADNKTDTTNSVRIIRIDKVLEPGKYLLEIDYKARIDQRIVYFENENRCIEIFKFIKIFLSKQSKIEFYQGKKYKLAII